MPEALREIKDELETHVGESVVVVAQAGRKKITTKVGILAETYPSLFIVELENDTFERVSYSYTDVLTNNIDITFK